MVLSYLNSLAHQNEVLIKAFGDLSPFFGTVFLAYIAYQQWQTNERKRRQELFEMRYEHLLKNIFKLINDESLTNISGILDILIKYRYLIKEKDFNKLLEYEGDTTNKSTKEKDFFTDKIYLILEPYLRIESDETIWNITKNFIIGTYEFLAPKWLQNFLSKTKTVILNLFQDLTNNVWSAIKPIQQDSESSSE